MIHLLFDKDKDSTELRNHTYIRNFLENDCSTLSARVWGSDFLMQSLLKFPSIFALFCWSCQPIELTPKLCLEVSIFEMTANSGFELTSRKARKKPWKRRSSLAKYSHGYLTALAITRFTHELRLDRLVGRPDSPKINKFLENSASMISNSTLPTMLFVFQSKSLSDSNEDCSIVQTPGFGSKGATSPTTSTVSRKQWWVKKCSPYPKNLYLREGFLSVHDRIFPTRR